MWMVTGLQDYSISIPCLVNTPVFVIILNNDFDKIGMLSEVLYAYVVMK
jgi:hypothetical protein